jgi:pimeloyl-ACP methyl ester carboxylesterase
VAIDHAAQAGDALALLVKEAQVSMGAATSDSSDGSFVCIRKGKPLSLIGYGMGARVIFNCLERLALSRDTSDSTYYVENVVLIGAPIPTDRKRWESVRSIVAGRLVNCYSTSDWFLALMYRAKSWDYAVAGLQPVELPPVDGVTDGIDMFQMSTGVENYDITELVHTHGEYPAALFHILSRVNLEMGP